MSCSGMACFTFPSPILLRSPTRSPIHHDGPSPSQDCTQQGTSVSCQNPLLYAAENFQAWHLSHQNAAIKRPQRWLDLISVQSRNRPVWMRVAYFDRGICSQGLVLGMA